MSKTKSLKVKQADGSYATISIGADALNIDLSNGSNVETTIETINTNITKNTNDIENLENKLNNQQTTLSALPIGAGVDYWGKEAPTGFMFAVGQELSRTEYSELFNVIGTEFGEGDGSTTFNLPNKSCRVTVAPGYFTNSVDTQQEFLFGQSGGTPWVSLTVDQMPSHTHTAKEALCVKTTTDEGNNTVLRSWTRTSAGISTTGVVSSVGSGQRHQNMPPYIVCNYIIRVK